MYGDAQTNCLVSVEMEFWITVEFDTTAIVLLRVVNGLLQTLSGETVERPVITRGQISFVRRLKIFG